MTENREIPSILRDSNLSPAVKDAAVGIWGMLDDLGKDFIVSAVEKAKPQDKLFTLATALGTEYPNIKLTQRERSA